MTIPWEMVCDERREDRGVSAIATERGTGPLEGNPAEQVVDVFPEHILPFFLAIQEIPDDIAPYVRRKASGQERILCFDPAWGKYC